MVVKEVTGGKPKAEGGHRKRGVVLTNGEEEGDSGKGAGHSPTVRRRKEVGREAR